MGIKPPTDRDSVGTGICTDRLRALGTKSREKLTDQEREQKSREAVQSLCALSEWETCGSILTFVSFGTEISTQSLIERALLEKKAVYCPKVFPEEKRMVFYRIRELSQLRPGFCRISEPQESAEHFVTGQEGQALMIVPGTAFDRQGNRIGYGGGYYDRYVGAIPQKNRPTLAGLCFACQLSDRIPVKSHDICMDLVVTENGALYRSKGR